MYDLWYTLGTAIMDPSLLTAINTTITAQGSPAFRRLKGRLFTEINPDGSTKTIPNTKTAGLLVPNVTAAVRQSIRTFIQGNAAAPPVSFYAAGKLSQFLAIGIIDSSSSHGRLDFVAIIGLAKQAFDAFPGAVSAGSTALLGLCIIDEKARAVIAGSMAAAKDPVFAEFSVPMSEQARITSIVGDSRFSDAQKSFLEGDGNTWNPNEGSSEQFFIWEDHSERAVF